MSNRLTLEVLEKLNTAVAEFKRGTVFQDIVVPRDSVLSRYQPVFSSERVDQITEDDFRGFLRFKNNRHWTGLTRTAPRMCSNMDKLRESLSMLVDENLPIEERYSDALRMLPGMGHNIATAILTVAHPDKYGVWNSRSKNNLEKLGLWPNFDRGESQGSQYQKINKVLVNLRNTLQLDLWSLDAFWYYLDVGETSIYIVENLSLITNGLDSWYQSLCAALREHGSTWLQQTKALKPNYIEEFKRQIKEEGYFRIYGYAQVPIKSIAYEFQATQIKTSFHRKRPPDNTVPVFGEHDLTQGKCRDESDFRYRTWLKIDHVEEIENVSLNSLSVHTTGKKLTTSSLRGLPHLYVVPTIGDPIDFSLPEIETVNAPIVSSDSLLALQRPSQNAIRSGSGGVRRSTHSKAIGDRAEEIVHKHLYEMLDARGRRTLRWLADEGEKLGYDIQYENQFGQIIGVEVKGTGGPLFQNIELTRNEWLAARDLRERYCLYLVAKCRSTKPIIQEIFDPVRLVEEGNLNIEPLSWRLSMIADH